MAEKEVIQDLNMKHRPRLWKHVVGQDSVVKMIRSKLDIGKLPHAIVLSGPSGTGKTTLAKIIGSKLGCADGDYVEINAANSRGIDTIRDIDDRMRAYSLVSGGKRMWVLDEIHRMTPDAQNALLLLLEDMPAHVYFVLVTTDPGRLIKTIITRCTQFKLSPVKDKHVKELVLRVAAQEGIELSDEVADKVVEAADGSPRKALVVLGQIAELETDEEKMAATQKAETAHQARELTQLVMTKGSDWGKVAAIIKDLDDDPESLRRMILGYANALILNGAKANLAAAVIEAFEGTYFHDGAAGKAQLIARCWALTH